MELHCLLAAFFVMSFSIHFWKWNMENHFSEAEVLEEGEGEGEGEEEEEEEDEIQGNWWTRKWVSEISEERHVSEILEEEHEQFW